MQTLEYEAPSAGLQWRALLKRLPFSKQIGDGTAYLLPFVTLVIVWHFVSASGRVAPNILPAPSVVAATGWELLLSGQLLSAAAVSIGRLGLGALLGGITGIVIGILIGLNRSFAVMLSGPLTFFTAIGGITWIPLALVWFGIGAASTIFLIWNSVFFLVVFNTALGAVSVPRVYEQAALTLGASRWQVVRDVLLPGALPNIIGGMRMGISFGWRALIAAEMIGASSGLGFMIYNAGAYQRADIIIAGAVVIGLIWLATDHLLLNPIQRWTVERWGMVHTPK